MSFSGRGDIKYSLYQDKGYENFNRLFFSSTHVINHCRAFIFKGVRVSGKHNYYGSPWVMCLRDVFFSWEVV